MKTDAQQVLKEQICFPKELYPLFSRPLFHPITRQVLGNNNENINSKWFRPLYLSRARVSCVSGRSKSWIYLWYIYNWKSRNCLILRPWTPHTVLKYTEAQNTHLDCEQSLFARKSAGKIVKKTERVAEHESRAQEAKLRAAKASRTRHLAQFFKIFPADFRAKVRPLAV